MITFEHRNQKFVIAVAGGGSGFLSDILQKGGASLWLIHAEIPYSTESFESFVGGVREKIVSESSARQLAVASEKKGNSLGFDCIGVGASCALLKDNEREGRIHKIFVAVKHKEYCVSVEWQGNLGSRESEENLASNLISCLSSGFAKYIHNRKHSIRCDFKIITDFTPIFGTEIKNGLKMNYPSFFAMDAIGHCRKNDCPSYNSQETYANFFKAKDKMCIYSGSFNPIHLDHINVFRKCEEIYGPESCFMEISVKNFGKPDIDSIELTKRIDGMRMVTKNIIVTNEPLIKGKARILGDGCRKMVFAVGFDTFKRIEKIHDENVSFLVFPRDGKAVFPNGNSGQSFTTDNNVEIESFSLTEGLNLCSMRIREGNNG
jgi:hypothetical protein